MIEGCVDERRVRDGGTQLLVVVPPSLPSWVQSLTRLIEGSGIDVVVDRRLVERRLTFGRRTSDRRRQDRWGPQQVFGYFHGCSIIVRVKPRATSQPEANQLVR